MDESTRDANLFAFLEGKGEEGFNRWCKAKTPIEIMEGLARRHRMEMAVEKVEKSLGFKLYCIYTLCCFIYKLTSCKRSRA